VRRSRRSRCPVSIGRVRSDVDDPMRSDARRGSLRSLCAIACVIRYRGRGDRKRSLAQARALARGESAASRSRRRFFRYKPSHQRHESDRRAALHSKRRGDHRSSGGDASTSRPGTANGDRLTSFAPARAPLVRALASADRRARGITHPREKRRARTTSARPLPVNARHATASTAARPRAAHLRSIGACAAPTRLDMGARMSKKCTNPRTRARLARGRSRERRQHHLANEKLARDRS